MIGNTYEKRKKRATQLLTYFGVITAISSGFMLGGIFVNHVFIATMFSIITLVSVILTLGIGIGIVTEEFRQGKTVRESLQQDIFKDSLSDLELFKR